MKKEDVWNEEVNPDGISEPLENSVNHIPTYIPTYIPTKSLAAPNKLEQGLSVIESFQEPIVNLPCV
jgi:hypothetical protein